MLVDLISRKITGKDLDAALGRAHITVNKNAVPNDPQSPFVTSGIRVGTPACTSRGFKENEAKTVAGWICDIIDNMGNESVVDATRGKVSELCKAFPLYTD
jgi:glycine hydroxymethyltransferase